jgi:protein-disulfide isomerase
MNKGIERSLSIALTMSAVLMAIVVVKREVESGQDRGGQPTSNVQRPEFYRKWRELLANGVETGNTTSTIKIIEFEDLECPACRYYQQTVLPPVIARFGQQVSHVFMHYPLKRHRNALPAARAAECAARQGRFSEFVSLVFAKQDSIGLKSWQSFAREVGVGDGVRFTKCTNEKAPMQRISAGLAFADSLQLIGTPAILVNGWRFSNPPSERELTRVVSELLANRSPFPELSRQESRRSDQ